jgi:hypothetical protein
MHLKTLSALAFLVLSSLSALAAPPPVPTGSEFRVDTAATTGFKPRIAAFPDGGFVVVWTGSGARARFLDAAGRPAGGVFRLAGVTGIVDQVVADRDGSFLLVWAGVSAAHPESNIFVRRFNRDGTPRGNRIRANLPSTSDRHDSMATIGPDGRFAVAWKADIPIPGSDRHYTDAVGRIFSAGGTPLTPEITLLPGEGPTPAGDDTIHAFPSGLVLRPNGTLAALVQETGECFQSYLTEVSRDNEPTGFHPLGSVFCGNPISGGLAASLAMGKDGSLVAAWSDSDVQAQRFAPNGTPRGDWFRIAAQATESYQYNPTVAVQAGGTFVIAWTEEDRDGEGRGIFGRAFAANGAPRTQDFRINVTTEGDQSNPAIAAGRQGPAVVVWTQVRETNEGSGIFARVLSPEQ